MCLIKQYSLKQASCVGLLVRSLLIDRRKQWHVIISIVSVLFGGQLVTSHPSSCYMTLISEQGRVKICKCSQSLFNQFSFSILSLFLRLKTGLNCTRKVVDQRRILSLNSVFDACCHSCQLSTYQYLQQQCSDSQVHCTSPLQTMKRK